jgi:hypothetical protein
LSFAGEWVGLENITLSEVNQVQKAKSHIFFSHLWSIDLIQIEKFYEKQVMIREGYLQEGEGKRRKLRR